MKIFMVIRRPPVEVFVNGILAALILLAFYFLTLRFANGSWPAAVSQFEELWLWVTLLDLGFGIQVGLYSWLRCQVKEKAAGNVVGVSAGTSALGMVACCAHHLSDLLPIIGLSGAFLFVADYQAWFVVLGLLSNAIGITYILKHLTMIMRRSS